MRLFIALTFEPDVCAALAQARDKLRAQTAKGSFTKDGNFHLTLAFLGEVAEDDLSTVEDALDSVTSDPRFDLVFSHVKQLRGGTWVVCTNEDKRLAHLQAEIVKLMTGIGIELESRPFLAHVTLARRVKLVQPDAGGQPGELQPLLDAPITAHVTSYSLMESHLTGTGPIYEEICAWE